MKREEKKKDEQRLGKRINWIIFVQSSKGKETKGRRQRGNQVMSCMHREYLFFFLFFLGSFFNSVLDASQLKNGT